MALALVLALPGSTMAASVSFANSYAFEDMSAAFGGGSVTHKYGSGVKNYLRATAHGDVFTNGAIVLVSRRAGGITSTGVKYTGPAGGTIKVKVKGNFSRELSGGFTVLNGAYFDHVIMVGLVDATANKVVASWTIANDRLLCGGLVYPIGFSKCNGIEAATYASTKEGSWKGASNGRYYAIRVVTLSMIQAGGVAGALQAKTTARNLSGSLTW